MNYKHAFHAGNFADVVKHALLTRILLHLAVKPAPFRFIDTHAGEGRYDLASAAADRTGEWRGGVELVRAARLPADAAALLAPYLAIVAGLGPSEYPGSPLVAAALLRRSDRMICCELVPAAAARLRDVLGRRAKVVALDGYAALNAFVPPVERRGLVLVDPPFEAADEFARLTDALATAHRKWATGVYAAWYPLKTPGAGQAFATALTSAGLSRLLRMELWVDAPDARRRLAGMGLIVVNPPFPLGAEAEILLPALATVLARDPAAAGWRAERLGAS